MGDVQDFLITAILNYDDELSSRVACGLVSDIANYFERNMIQYCEPFMSVLDQVLYKSEFSTETKMHAMIAVGDICLATEEEFMKHFDRTMDCLMSAANITIQPQNFETED
jgi:hypothetical protein